MSQLIDKSGNAVSPNETDKPMSASVDSFKLQDNMCDRQDCCNKATKKPVVHLRSFALDSGEEVSINIKVCDEHATKKDADDLVEGASSKRMMQDIYKTATGLEVDWSCSGAAWVDL